MSLYSNISRFPEKAVVEGQEILYDFCELECYDLISWGRHLSVFLFCCRFYEEIDYAEIEVNLELKVNLRNIYILSRATFPGAPSYSA